MGDDLRRMVREVLAEEFGARQAAADGGTTDNAPDLAVREEVVALDSDGGLQAFVARLLALAADGRARAEIEAGRHVFRLGQAAPRTANGAASRPMASTAAGPARFERGLISERDIKPLARDVSVLQIGKNVRLTPLAQDELRRRGIVIERMRS